ncbi:MAG TPA: hypothetical protein VMF06_03750 [Candidatus Limnocylindria bacterium]|jgi:hypothetical protein|nr:hypothetical protein [Candidatus Limnocylindria bacterium]
MALAVVAAIIMLILAMNLNIGHQTPTSRNILKSVFLPGVNLPNEEKIETIDSYERLDRFVSKNRVPIDTNRQAWANLGTGSYILLTQDHEVLAAGRAHRGLNIAKLSDNTTNGLFVTLISGEARAVKPY